MLTAGTFLSRLNGTGVNYSSLEDGMKYLLSVLDLSGVGTKLVLDLSLYWWVLILTFLFAFLLSLLWIGQFILGVQAFLLYLTYRMRRSGENVSVSHFAVSWKKM
jgi:uncharacterized membrane protein